LRLTVSRRQDWQSAVPTPDVHVCPFLNALALPFTTSRNCVDVIYVVLTMATVDITVLCDVTSCDLVEIYGINFETPINLWQTT